MEILVQALGFIAMFFSVFSFQMNKHKHIMLMQLFATLFFGIQYMMLDMRTGSILNLINVARDIIFYHRDKKWAKSPLWVYGFMLTHLVLGIITFDTVWSAFITVAMILNTLTFSITNPKIVRMTIFISSPLVLIYSIAAHSMGGVLNESFVLVSSFVGMFRYDFKKNNNKQ